MVLGFGRKSRKSEAAGPRIRSSPSLPELAAGGIPWPEYLVDAAAVKAERQAATATKSSSHMGGSIPFHKPFRSPPTSYQTANDAPRPSIADIYINQRSASVAERRPSAIKRPTRVPPTFNVMVIGAHGTGKSTLLRLLLDSSDISPFATAEQLASVEKFKQLASKGPTKALSTASVEISEPRYERVSLTVIDTPGLSFEPGKELVLERSVSGIVKYFDSKFAETLNEESKVVRQSKGDQHVHLCIYLIDPNSIRPASEYTQSIVPMTSRSQTRVQPSTYHPPDLSSMSEDTTSSDSEDDSQSTHPPPKNRLTMSPSEIKVIRRLSNRVTILPVIARSDSLTDNVLATVKKVVKRDLQAAGIDFDVFFGRSVSRDRRASLPNSRPKPNGLDKGRGTNSSETARQPGLVEEEEEEDEEDERASRPVIKIRTTRYTRTGGLSRSRSRPRRIDDHDKYDHEEDFFEMLSAGAPDSSFTSSAPAESTASTPTKENAPRLVRSRRQDVEDLLPFAFIAPEMAPYKVLKPKPVPLAVNGDLTPSAENVDGDGEDSSVPPTPDTSGPGSATPHTTRSRNATFSLPAAFQHSRNFEETLRGRFVRKYRWGTIDVMDPDHCDYAALRRAVLGGWIKALKATTKEVLYERYRTEKLLARRATQNITDDQHKKMMRDLGI